MFMPVRYILDILKLTYAHHAKKQKHVQKNKNSSAAETNSVI